MMEMTRLSPVDFKTRVLRSEKRNGWQVVLEYENETTGQYLIDLSHLRRWDVQDANLAKIEPFGVAIPSRPGESVLSGSTLINRMNGTQASIWQFADKIPQLPQESAYTDVSEATVALALIGEKTYAIAEKLSSLDFLDPQRQSPFLLQGPFCRVPCQVVALSKGEGRDGMLLTCSRGYAQSMVHAVLEAGDEFGILPAGESKFDNWISLVSKFV